jgi:hypothetical protein
MRVILSICVLFVCIGCTSSKTKIVTLQLKTDHFFIYDIDQEVRKMFNGFMEEYDTVIINYSERFFVAEDGSKGYIATVKNDTASLYLYRLCRVFQKSMADSSGRFIGNKLEIVSVDNKNGLKNEIRQAYHEAVNSVFECVSSYSHHTPEQQVWVKLSKGHLDGDQGSIKYIFIRDVNCLSQSCEYFKKLSKDALSISKQAFEKDSYQIEL